ncbi:stage II sporulation protein M [Tindallia magadiensis]|uniref:Stage II sporulation protein M n=1 Tax=Tindallia magadiensis TaxID=69895 RepID=A0A1I3E142_9FIRM|nr:stage II sporulation protein M [Tindallia magadiensis]SFH92411.1 stage II sporulation protein M [Tindallia magadiensis]
MLFQLFIKPFSQHRKWFFLSSLLFFGSLFLFKALAFIYYEEILQLFSLFFDDLEELASDVFFGPSMWQGVRILFMNNLRASLMMLLGGIILIFPILGIIVNGGLVGAVSALVLKEGSMGLFGFYVVGILPHGIFELPAILLSGAIGLKISKEIISPPQNESRKRRLKKNYQAALWSLPLVITLLAIAAVLEVFLTPWLMELYFLT